MSDPLAEAFLRLGELTRHMNETSHAAREGLYKLSQVQAEAAELRRLLLRIAEHVPLEDKCPH